jgi:hypothetical protein
MAAKTINWTLNVNIPGGPSISASNPLEIEAYDMIEVEITNSTETKVQIMPGGSAEVRLLAIRAEPFKDANSNVLTYKVSDGTASSAAIRLDAPVHFYGGAGSVGVLGIVPNNLHFANPLLDKDNKTIPVTIQVLVGRDATPAPPGP